MTEEEFNQLGADMRVHCDKAIPEVQREGCASCAGYAAMNLSDIKPGDKVVRMLGGTIPMQLKVSAVDEYIHCGPWKFSKANGAEIDEELGWNEKQTGSFLKYLEKKTNA